MQCNQSRPGFELVSRYPFPTTITITPRANNIYDLQTHFVDNIFKKSEHTVKWFKVLLVNTNNSIDY